MKKKSLILAAVLLFAVVFSQNSYCTGLFSDNSLPAAGPDSGDKIGHWFEDSSGMPGYEYTGTLPYSALDENGKVTEQAEDPHFLLGNRDITLIAHVSGNVEFMTARRGWARFNACPDRPDYGLVDASLTVDGRNLKLTGENALSADPAVCRRMFGPGYATWHYTLPSGVECTRTISIRPTENLDASYPFIITDVTVRNTGRSAVRLEYREDLPVHYVPMADSRSVRYPVESSSAKVAAVARISAEQARFVVVPQMNEASKYDFYPYDIFVASADGSGHSASGNILRFEKGVELKPGESRTFSFVTGLCVSSSLKRLFSSSVKNSVPDESGRFNKEWKNVLPDLSTEKDPVLRREMLWDAHFVKASSKYSEFYDETFISQGSVYSYHYGDNIAARDLLDAALPACYTDPALAKSIIRYVFKHTKPDGEITRGDCGYGYVAPTIYQESDPQLYAFMTVGEYLRITGDYPFLKEVINYAPGYSDTIEGLLERQFTYLRDVVGVGRHGLVRLLNSDWSDSFLHRHSPNVTLGEAESHLNSAMALCVLPEFISQMRKAGYQKFADVVTEYRASLLPAFLKEIEGRPFCPRAYVRGTLYGGDVVCLEPHSFLFGIPEIPAERKREIYNNIYKSLNDSWGLRTRDRSMWGSTPEGEDGGIWFALEYPLLLGVSTFDRDEAERLLKMFSFDNYAKTHPNYWVGRWTAPDELNSSLSRDGLYAFWVSMPDRRLCFQGWCSHPHTWPLYCYYKLKE